MQNNNKNLINNYNKKKNTLGNITNNNIHKENIKTLTLDHNDHNIKKNSKINIKNLDLLLPFLPYLMLIWIFYILDLTTIEIIEPISDKLALQLIFLSLWPFFTSSILYFCKKKYTDEYTKISRIIQSFYQVLTISNIMLPLKKIIIKIMTFNFYNNDEFTNIISEYSGIILKYNCNNPEAKENFLQIIIQKIDLMQPNNTTLLNNQLYLLQFNIEKLKLKNYFIEQINNIENLNNFNFIKFNLEYINLTTNLKELKYSDLSLTTKFVSWISNILPSIIPNSTCQVPNKSSFIWKIFPEKYIYWIFSNPEKCVQYTTIAIGCGFILYNWSLLLELCKIFSKIIKSQHTDIEIHKVLIEDIQKKNQKLETINTNLLNFINALNTKHDILEYTITKLNNVSESTIKELGNISNLLHGEGIGNPRNIRNFNTPNYIDFQKKL